MQICVSEIMQEITERPQRVVKKMDENRRPYHSEHPISPSKKTPLQILKQVNDLLNEQNTLQKLKGMNKNLE